MLERVWRKGNPPTLLVGLYIGIATMESHMEVAKKTKNRATMRFSNPTPRHISRKNYNSKRYTYPYVHNSTIHNNRNMKAT